MLIVRFLGPVLLFIVLYLGWRWIRPKVMAAATRHEMESVKELSALADEADGASKKGKGGKLAEQVAKDSEKIKSARDAAAAAEKAL